MDQLIYITSSIVIVAVIAVLSIIRMRQFLKEKNNGSPKQDSIENGALTTIAISLAGAGIVIGTESYIAYSFFGASILVSLIGMVKYRRFI